MANTHSSLHSPPACCLPAGDSQVFDVGQQKDMLRATGNSPAEHLNCRELLEAGGRQERGGSLSSQRLRHRRDKPPRFQERSVDCRQSPQGLPWSRHLPAPAHTLDSADHREDSLFPICNSLFLFHSRQRLCPPPPLWTLKSNLWKA